MTKQVTFTTSSFKATSDFTAQVRHELRDMLCVRLQVQSLQPLGDGCYAEVFQHPHRSNRVIKIATNSPRYTNYLLWCAQHQDNPYVPRLESVEVFEIQTRPQGFCRHAVIVTMEKLRRAARTKGHLEEVITFLGSGNAPLSLRSRPHFEDLNKLRKALGDELECLCVDAHDGNVLRRGSQPVVTDPVVG